VLVGGVVRKTSISTLALKEQFKRLYGESLYMYLTHPKPWFHTLPIKCCKSPRNSLQASQKNLHQMNIIINSPNPPNGPYCFSNSSQLILTAACLYFLLSSLNRELTSPIRSRESPLYSRSSIFFVITFVTSLSSSFNLSRFCVARVSEYVALVREMKVSNSMNAYGRNVGERTWEEG